MLLRPLQDGGLGFYGHRLRNAWLRRTGSAVSFIDFKFRKARQITER